MKRFLLLLIVTVALASMVLTGCGSKETKLTVLMISGHDVGLESLLEEFEEDTGIDVEIVTVSMPDLYTKLDTEFAAGGNSYDVAEMMWAAAQGYARAGYLYELDDFMQEADVDVSQYTSVYVDNHMIQYPQTENGAYICLPHQADLQILAYREDLFDDASEQAAFLTEYGYTLKVPETYDEFLDVAKFFTRPDDDLYGAVVMGKNFPSLVGDITPYIRAFGGDWIDDTYHPVINSAESKEAIQYYYDLFAEHEVTPEGCATYSWEEEIADYQHGKIAMMIIWPGQVVSLEDKEVSDVAGNIGYAVVPGKAPTVGGWALTIPKKSKNPEASFEFMEWLASTEVALQRAQDTGFSTATQALFDDPVMNQKFNYLHAFENSLPYGEGWPQIGEFTSIWQIGAEEISRVFSGEISVEEAADNMQNRFDELMQSGDYY
ncbi:MAG: sugar ABC transporter substrate-binding protein [Chloroflexota bacterium]|nr:sugar ABC transporter substrate-binding protein [Chloroflexota bacterium]